MSSLKNKVAVITGASTGIGESIARSFATEGASVVLASRDREKLQGVADRLADTVGGVLVAPTDVTIEKQVVALFHQAKEKFNRIDLLVNNAGIAQGGPSDEMTAETWRNVIDVNLTGSFLCSREAFKIMKTQRAGRIINIGSVSAKVPRPHSAPYVASKFGLEGLTRSLALDGREFGISASIVHPGNTDTPIWHGREEVSSKEGLMPPDELARVVLMIATIPPDMNVLESIVLPVSMPFLGRG